jgi:putative transposase
MIRSYRYPLRPTQEQEVILSGWLRSCCALYNGALQERRAGWRRGLKIDLYSQCRSLTEIRSADPAWRDIPARVARSALRRLDNAYKAFFRRCKAGEKPGYPRFRSSRRYESFGLQGPAPIRDGRVVLPKLGPVKVHFYRPIPAHGQVLDVIVRRELDRWYVVFQVDLGPAPAQIDVVTIPEERIVGLDVGLAALATLSTGETIANPRHGQRAQAILARRQRDLARKRKGSKSRQRAVLLVGKAHAQVHNQRLDMWRIGMIGMVSRAEARRCIARRCTT